MKVNNQKNLSDKFIEIVKGTESQGEKVNAHNKYFANKLNISVDQVQELIEELVESGQIEVNYHIVEDKKYKRSDIKIK